MEYEKGLIELSPDQTPPTYGTGIGKCNSASPTISVLMEEHDDS